VPLHGRRRRRAAVHISRAHSFCCTRRSSSRAFCTVSATLLHTLLTAFTASLLAFSPQFRRCLGLITSAGDGYLTFGTTGVKHGRTEKTLSPSAFKHAPYKAGGALCTKTLDISDPTGMSGTTNVGCHFAHTKTGAAHPAPPAHTLRTPWRLLCRTPPCRQRCGSHSLLHSVTLPVISQDGRLLYQHPLVTLLTPQYRLAA